MSVLHGLEAVRASSDGAIGTLVLHRPAKLNALSRQLIEELIQAAHWFDEQDELKVVLVAAAGRAFSAGADLAAMAPADGATGTEAERQRDALDAGRRMTDAIAGMRALTVAAIHGHCVGGGVVLATACDLRLAADDARFWIPEVDLGIPLTWGGIPRLVRELGPSLTKDLVLTCRPFGADEALAMRFVTRVVARADLEREGRAIAAKLASQPAYSLALTKRHVNAVAEEAGSTAQASAEVETLLAALRDEESLAAMARYLAARAR